MGGGSIGIGEFAGGSEAGGGIWGGLAGSTVKLHQALRSAITTTNIVKGTAQVR